MSKKFSILKVDINKLHKETLDFMASTGEAHPYLFMGKDTARALLESMDKHEFDVKWYNPNLVGYYEGYKVYLDTDLAFDEIEIR